ncbi:MAG: TMEM165/GDT1 family protein [Bacillota bacterium]
MSPRGSYILNWQTVFSTFVAVFLAELGDKTQLSTMMLAASKKTPWSVFLGSAMALVLSSFIGVLVGDSLYRIVPGNIIKYSAGGAFVIIGLLMLSGKL